MSSRKGGAYERDICKRLSVWWGGRDDIFWRSSGSGARATVRAKRGKTTTGSCGDITIIDPIGRPLLDFLTFEIKRGYSEDSLHTLLDKDYRHKQQTWEEWLLRAKASAETARSMGWALITKRDQKLPLITVPLFIHSQLMQSHAFIIQPSPFIELSWKNIVCCTMLLDDWLEGVEPKHILSCLERR